MQREATWDIKIESLVASGTLPRCRTSICSLVRVVSALRHSRILIEALAFIPPKLTRPSHTEEKRDAEDDHAQAYNVEKHYGGVAQHHAHSAASTSTAASSSIALGKAGEGVQQH
jgi:hypothetical protein